MDYTKYVGIYKGIVVDTNDPKGFNRIKVRIPDIHGPIDENVYALLKDINRKGCHTNDDELPWAEVCYPYGSDAQPEVNQVVCVQFINGLRQFPVIIGWFGYEYTNNEEMLQVYSIYK